MEQIGGDHITHVIKIFIIRIDHVKQNSDEKCKGLLLLCYSHVELNINLQHGRAYDGIPLTFLCQLF